MLSLLQRQIIACTIVVLGVLNTSGTVEAGWVIIQNQTRKVIVIQESITCNGQVIRCRPVRLLPDENTRHLHNQHTITVEVFDPQCQNARLGRDTLIITSEKQTFIVQPSGRTIPIPAKPR